MRCFVESSALLGLVGRLSIAAIGASVLTGALAFWLAQFQDTDRSRLQAVGHGSRRCRHADDPRLAV